MNREINEATKEQEDIGWWNMMLGLHSNKWQIIQQAHYKRIGSKRSAKRWTSLVIRKLWEIAWDMWQHRCRVAHDTVEVSLGLSNNLDQTIKEESRQGVPPNCPAHYRKHFSRRTVQSVLRKPMLDKQRWLHLASSLRRQLNAQQSEGRSQQQRHTLYAFLRPANPQWNPNP